jgi:hypothetical protein
MSRKGADLRKQVDELKRELRNSPAKERVRLERGAKHTQVRDPKNGRIITTLPDTPSDYRSFANVLAKLRKANVFKDQKVIVRSDRFALPEGVQADALHLLDILGYKPNELGKRQHATGALTALSKYMMQASEEIGVRRGRPLNSFQSIVSNVIVQGKLCTAETIDVIARASEIGLAKVTDQVVPPLSEPKPEPELVEEQAEQPEPKLLVHTFQTEPAGEKPVEKEPENGKVNIESLHLRVLAAILDHNTTTEQAMELAVEIAHIEGH